MLPFFGVRSKGFSRLESLSFIKEQKICNTEYREAAVIFKVGSSKTILEYRKFFGGIKAVLNMLKSEQIFIQKEISLQHFSK